MRSLVTILASAFIAVISLIVGILAGPWFGLAALLALAGIFVCTGLVEIKANPPHVGVVTFMGKRTNSVLREGTRFLPFNKILYDFIQISIVKKNLDFPAVTFRTPDRAELEAKISLTVVPSEKNIIGFLDSGEWDGIKNILQDTVSERIRTWAISPKEGPANWMEAQASGSEALAVILKSLFGDIIETIPSNIPTSSLIKFFSTSEEEMRKDAEKRGLTGEEQDKEVAWYKEVERQLKNEDYDDVKKAVAKRLKTVSDIRQGKFKKDIPDYGIKILRANISDIHVIGSVATAADLQAKEKQETLAEEAEIRHVQGLANIVKMAHPDLTSDQAFQIVMLERRKITKTVDDKNINLALPNIPAGVLEIVRALLKVDSGKGGND